MNSVRRLVPIAAALLAWSATTLGQLNPSDTIPTDPAIRIGRLDNGLTYYIRHNAKPKSKVELRLVIRAGSVLEDEDQQGLAHFVEHMAFNGTKHFKKNELVSFLQSIGVSFGADVNAYTSFDETRYRLSVPTDRPGNLETGFMVLRDWASGIKFSQKEIDKERGVVLEEARLRKGAGDRIRKVTVPFILGDSKYARRLPIGQEEILKTFKRDALVRFYTDWYRPELMAVVVVGDVDAAKAEELITKNFAVLKNPAVPRQPVKATIPGYNSSRGLVVTDKEATGHSLHVYHSNQPQRRDVTWADYRSTAMRNYFRGLVNQRIRELEQKSDPPFLSAFAGPSEFVQGYEAYMFSISLAKHGVQRAVEAVFAEAERVRKFGFTEAEFERVKKNTQRSRERAYNERQNLESTWIANGYANHFIDRHPMPGMELMHQWYKNFLETVTLEEMNRYAEQTAAPESPVAIVFTGHDKADFDIPGDVELVKLVEQARNVEVTPYIEKAVASHLMDEIPDGGEIVSEKEIKELGVTELMLSNQVKVLLRPTDFRNDEIMMSATRLGGSSLYDDRFNAEFSSRIVRVMGVGDHAPSEINKILAGKQVLCSPLLNEYSEDVSGHSGSKDVEALLQLTYLHFTKPRMDEELFKSFITREQTSRQNRSSSPMAVYSDTLYKVLYKGHPRAFRAYTPEDLGQIDANRSLEIYRERFGNASGFTFLFVGSFKVDSIKPLLARYLGGLPSVKTTSPPAFRDLGVRQVEGVVKKELFQGAEPKSHITMIFTGEGSPAEEANVRVGMLTEVLNIKLTETLREKLSSTYSSGLSRNISRVPYQHYSIRFSAPCGPENVNKVIDATLAEIKKIKEDGPTKEDLDKVKEARIQRYRTAVRQNNFWLGMLSIMVQTELPVRYMTDAESMVNAVTVEDLRKVANEYFDMKNYVQVVLYPEK